MATSADYARGIVRTTSGVAIDRPTRISAMSIAPLGDDTCIKLRDGESNGAIVWIAEGDNASSGYSQTFNPPLRFYNKVYMEFASSGANSSCSIAVIEP